MDYDVNLPTLTTTRVNLFQLNKKLNDAATNWITFDDQKVDINRTKSAIKSESLFGCALCQFVYVIYTNICALKIQQCIIFENLTRLKLAATNNKNKA